MEASARSTLSSLMFSFKIYVDVNLFINRRLSLRFNAIARGARKVERRHRKEKKKKELLRKAASDWQIHCKIHNSSHSTASWLLRFFPFFSLWFFSCCCCSPLHTHISSHSHATSLMGRRQRHTDDDEEEDTRRIQFSFISSYLFCVVFVLLKGRRPWTVLESDIRQVAAATRLSWVFESSDRWGKKNATPRGERRENQNRKLCSFESGRVVQFFIYRFCLCVCFAFLCATTAVAWQGKLSLRQKDISYENTMINDQRRPHAQ